MIARSTIEEVRDRMDIEEVVGDFVTLKRKGSGKYLWACCPFHDEKTPSFAVTPDKGIYKCFGCGRSGDTISFVMDHDGLSYIEAIRYLAQKYGIEVKETEQSDEAQEIRNEKESLYIVLNFAQEYFVKNLRDTDEGRSIGLSYLKERGIDARAMEKFGLGYSMGSWDDLYKHALENQYEEDLLEKAGLIVRKDEKKVYDRFRGRVMFPIHNVSGKVIAFGARTLRKDDKPKYLNSPESEVYHKSRILYGIHQARQAIRQADNCYLTEGYTDVIAMHMAGIENVVASSGTSLTNDQIKLISRFSKNITVLYDGDPAGIKASLRGIDMILEAGMNVRTLVFPEGHDPDSYSQELGSAAFARYLEENTRDFISFKVDLFVREAGGDPIKKASAINDIIQTISKIPDGVKRSLYIKESARLLEMDEGVLVTELNKILIRERRKKPEAAPQPPPDFMPDSLEVESKINQVDLRRLKEKEALRVLVRYGQFDVVGQPLHEYFSDEIQDIELESDYRLILEWYSLQIDNGNLPEDKVLLGHADEEIKEKLIDLYTDKYEVSPYWFDKYKIYVPHEKDDITNLITSTILRLKHQVINELIIEQMERIKKVESLEEEEKEILIFQSLKDIEMSIAGQLGIVIPK